MISKKEVVYDHPLEGIAQLTSLKQAQQLAHFPDEALVYAINQISLGSKQSPTSLCNQYCSTHNLRPDIKFAADVQQYLDKIEEKKADKPRAVTVEHIQKGHQRLLSDSKFQEFARQFLSPEVKASIIKDYPQYQKILF